MPPPYVTIEKGLRDLSTRIKMVLTGASTDNHVTLSYGAAASTASSIASRNVINEKNLPLMSGYDGKPRWIQHRSEYRKIE